MPNTKQTWDQVLRASLKQDEAVLKGLTIENGRGSLKLNLRSTRYGTGKRTFVGIPFSISRKSTIEKVVRQVSELIRDKSKTFAEACDAIDNRGAEHAGEISWPKVIEDVFAANSGWRDKTRKDYLTTSKNFLKLFDQPETSPRDARQVFRRYSDLFFGKCAPGSPQRGRHFDRLVLFMDHAVSQFGADPCWSFNDEQLRIRLIGQKVVSAKPKKTAPVKDRDLAVLLDRLNSSNPSLYLAVALVALYGLRPAELAQIDVDENGQLIVWNNIVKRNRRTMNKEPWSQVVYPLDVPGRGGEGRKVFDLWRGDLVQLPNAVLNAIAKAKASGNYKQVGDAFRQLLDRNEHWQELQRQQDVNPYSLRHSYAWRGHRSYERPMPIRDMAMLMRHSVQVHQREYGTWVDDVSLQQMVQQTTGVNVETPSAELTTSRYI